MYISPLSTILQEEGIWKRRVRRMCRRKREVVEKEDDREVVYGFMVFNALFNNISAILLRLGRCGEEGGNEEENMKEEVENVAENEEVDGEENEEGEKEEMDVEERKEETRIPGVYQQPCCK